MRIGIDIDNTITHTRESVFKYKRRSRFKHNKGYYLDWDKKDQDEFLKEYVEDIQMNAKVKEGAPEVIEKLHNLGHKIILITYRNNILNDNLIDNTKKYLKKNNIYYDDILFNALEKGKICKYNKIDLLIDDSPVNIESVKNAGIKYLVYPMFYNKKLFPRVNNWYEVLDYIKKLQDK